MKIGCAAYHVHDPNLSFIRTDILQFAARYDRVLLFSTVEPDQAIKSVANIIVCSPALDWTRYRPVSLLTRYGLLLLVIWIGEMIAVRRWMPMGASIKKLITNIFQAKEVLRVCREHKALDAIHYSFWWYDSVFLAWLRRKEGVHRTVTRTHGGDLYEERGSLKVDTLFRSYQLSGLDAVYSVSEAGTRYLKERYPAYRERIRTGYLGTADHGMAPDPGSDAPLVIVSCAKVRNIKRVHLIGEALEHVKGIHVRWVHFGGMADPERDASVGRFMRTVERLREQVNVQVQLMGEMNNDAILDWYRKQPANCFISMSSTEGVPVSMMEAISFGIPVLSTDVGGCREIVNDRTGMLIPLDTPVDEVARIIEGFGKSRFSRPGFRKGVREEWANKFDAVSNYQKFFGELETN